MRAEPADRPESPEAPFGRRLCTVAESRLAGGYRIFTLIDESGPAPAPGQFFMLAAEAGWAGEGGRPYLPRAISHARFQAASGGMRLDFLIDEVGPGTSSLAAMKPGERCWVAGPFGRRFSLPRQLNEDAAGAILVGGGIGIAPMAVLRRELVDRGIPSRSLLGFRDQAHSGGVEELFGCEETRLAFEDGSAGHKGYVTDLLLKLLEGDDSGSAAVYSCGPPAMLEAVRRICIKREIPVELALESPMACGYGACFGCAVPKAGGGYMRLCIDGPVVRGDEIASAMAGSPPLTDLATDICGIPLAGPVLNGSGTFDALAARKVFGDPLVEEFPFDCYVSKTITMNPRPGNPPYRLWETPSGMINSIGLPGPGVEGFLERDLIGLSELGVPLIVSVMADSAEDFSVLVEKVAARDEVAGIELNVSCPNVHSGLIVGEQPSETEALMKALRPLTPKPLIVKLTPNVANPHEVAVAAEAGGADSVSMINTVKAAAIDPVSNRAWLGAGAGGLSGPAIRPIALAQVRAVSSVVGIPVIGMGGITDAEQALEFILAGARVIAVGTENFRDPRAGTAVTEGLPAALERRGFGSLAEAQSATLA